MAELGERIRRRLECYVPRPVLPVVHDQIDFVLTRPLVRASGHFLSRVRDFGQDLADRESSKIVPSGAPFVLSCRCAAFRLFPCSQGCTQSFLYIDAHALAEAACSEQHPSPTGFHKVVAAFRMCVILSARCQEVGMRQCLPGCSLRPASPDFIRFPIGVSKRSESGWVPRHLASGAAES